MTDMNPLEIMQLLRSLSMGQAPQGSPDTGGLGQSKIDRALANSPANGQYNQTDTGASALSGGSGATWDNAFASAIAGGDPALKTIYALSKFTPKSSPFGDNSSLERTKGQLSDLLRKQMQEDSGGERHAPRRESPGLTMAPNGGRSVSSKTVDNSSANGLSELIGKKREKEDRDWELRQRQMTEEDRKRAQRDEDARYQFGLEEGTRRTQLFSQLMSAIRKAMGRI